MTARVIDVAAVAQPYRAETRDEVRTLGRPLRVVGILTQSAGPAHTYAQYARRGAEETGIAMEIREPVPTAAAVEAAIREANGDPGVDGVFLYYPVADPVEDRWLRELVDPRKDVEAMHSFWTRLLYENRRYVDDAQTLRAILPCTPLGILKLLEAAGLRSPEAAPAAPLAGLTACVINRSEIVGRPLSAMLANDGMTVVSLDLTGAVVFEPAIGRHSHAVRDAELDRGAALRDADVVITGVPSRDFPLIGAAELKPGVICLNFSEFRNFDDSMLDVASAFVPRVGPMTVAMATRNLVRLAALRSAGQREERAPGPAEIGPQTSED